MSTTQKRRKDKGLAGNGGQYATLERGEATVAVAQTRFIEDPEIASTATQWWNQAAKLTDTSGKVPSIGRDGGPVRRKTYRGEDYSITMPSNASVHRFARQVAERTGDEGRHFEMPIEYAGPDGRSVMTAVRVRRQGRRFDVTMPSGFDESRKAQVAESLRANLESRRPTMSAEATRDLIERYRSRASRTGVQTRQVASSFIKEIGYNQDSGRAMVVMNRPSKNNATGAYEYEISPEEWRTFVSHESPGKGYHAAVRGRGHESLGMARQCEDCGRYYGAATPHECPAES